MDPAAKGTTISDGEIARRRAALVDLFNGAPIKTAMGIEIAYDAEGRAVFTLLHTGSHDHALGDYHGGVIATMLDNAGWFTVAPYYDCWLVTVEFSVRILEPGKCETLRAVGYPVRVGKRIAVAEMRVFGANDRLVATGAGTFSVTAARFGDG